MAQDVYVVGVGMIPFAKPGSNEPYPVMAAGATREALANAGIGYEQVQQAYAGYVYGDSTAGQRALYEVGMSRIPIFNVNNRPVPCPAGGAVRRRRVRPGAGLRGDEPRRARYALQ